MTNMIRAAIAALAIAVTAAPAQAAPVSYTINFVRTGGDTFAAPTGSFGYDAAAAPGFRFSDFQVAWIGLNFDLTSSANNPNVSPGGACSADTFQNLVTGMACTNPDPISGGVRWSGGAAELDAVFFQITDLSSDKVPSSTSGQLFQIRNLQSATPGTEFGSSGTLTIAIAPPTHAVPAPGTLGLLAVGLAGALFRRMRSLRRAIRLDLHARPA